MLLQDRSKTVALVNRPCRDELQLVSVSRWLFVNLKNLAKRQSLESQCRTSLRDISRLSVRETYQLPNRHLGEVTQAQVQLVAVDFILQVQHFAVFTHSDVREEKHKHPNQLCEQL